MTAATSNPPAGPLLGCVADDYTGGTDVASALRREGLRTTLLFGPPRPDWTVADADAVVVALKSRNDDLAAIATTTRELPVVTGAAGLVRLLSAALRGSGAGRPVTGEAGRLPGGPTLILAGSSSAATLEQVAQARSRYPAFRLDPAATPDPGDLQAKAVDWMGQHLDRGTVLVYASAPPGERGPAGGQAAQAIERTMAELARAAVGRGVRRLVVAGGETSGAVVDGLGIDRVVVARDEDVGVPWLVTADPAPLALLLKSGNFGRPDLLVRAAETS